MTRVCKPWLILGVVGWMAACAVEQADSLDDQGDDVQTGCAPGAQVACACTDGSTGVQACLPEGVFGPCECSSGPQTAPGCVAGTTASCTCADGSYGSQVCAADGLFGPCECTPVGSGGSGGSAITGGSGGTITGGTGGAATGGVTTGGSSGAPTGGAGGFVTGGAGGSPTGGTGGSGGTPTGGTGGTPTGGTGGSGGAPPGENDPIIPSPDGTCPTFASGSQTIKGLDTNILAGTPGATKGPLLFTWHGTGSSGNVALNFQLPSSVRNEISAQGGLVIAPNDDGSTRTGSSPNGVWYETSDLEYADHIVACAVQNHNIDPRRIYVTGCSAGGLMAGAMAVKRSNYIAAAAPNSGGVASTFGLSFQDPSRVPAVLTMHGGSGDTVVINFQNTSETFLNFITPDGFGVDCNHESGHCGAPSELTEAAWEFMKAHSFGTSPSPYASGLPASFPSYCEIW